MSDSLLKHYRKLYSLYGDSTASVQYTDRASQYRRFEVLSEISNQIHSIVDVGCGLAHLYDFLRSKGFSGQYTGLDFVPDFIEASKKKCASDSQASFEVFDIAHTAFPKNHEYFFLSGVFNNKMPNNRQFMLDAITNMFDACTKGVSFNAMSTYVDYKDDELYYSDPLEIFDFCKLKLTRKVTLRHDYVVKEGTIPFEYAIYLYK